MLVMVEWPARWVLMYGDVGFFPQKTGRLKGSVHKGVGSVTMTKSTVGGMDSDEGRMGGGGGGIVNDVVKEGVCDGTGSRNRRGAFFECSLFRVVVCLHTLPP